MKAKMVAVSALAVVLVGAGSAVGATTSGSHPRSHVQGPPGWVAQPRGGPGQGTVCFDAVCYRVDGLGQPYGVPLASD